MWDWGLEEWTEFNKKQEKMLDEWRTCGMTDEQKQRYYESKNKPKCSKPEPKEEPIDLIIYLAVMAVGLIFVDRWLIWIAATAIYFGSKLKKL